MTSTTIPDDILWNIFSQNVPEYPIVSRVLIYRSPLFNNVTPHFLTTARSSSQVCRDWRRVMFSASNIWAKVFDFEELSKYSRPALWLKAIIKRSGTCGLTVYGKASNPDSLNGFLQLIQLCWHRVETVHVDLEALMNGANYDFTRHPAWTTLNHTPSPTLRYFRLKLGSCGYLPSDTIFTHKPRYLMIDSKNTAIRHLFVEETSQFAYHVDAPILRNLRTLSLSGLYEDDFYYGKGGSFPCSVEDFLTILRGARFLESLNIDEAVLLDMSEPIPHQLHLRAELPYLKHIELESNISECLGLLSHIVPNKICGLELRCHINWESVDPVAQLEALYNLVCDQSVRHTPFDEETWISFNGFPEINVHSLDHAKHFRFAVWAGDSDPGIPLNFIQLLLRPAFDFSSLPHVHLTLSNSKYAQDISPTDLFAFLNKFENLRTLSIPWDDFSMFLDKLILIPSFSNNRLSILPFLEELTIDATLASTTPELETPSAMAVIEFCCIFLQDGLEADAPLVRGNLKRLNLRWAPDSINALIKEAASSGTLGHLEITYRPPISPRPLYPWDLLIHDLW